MLTKGANHRHNIIAHGSIQCPETLGLFPGFLYYRPYNAHIQEVHIIQTI